ncbi:MAG: UDP-3-O-(3-hydroxymyristoyl)glucosamine N-acyltransferase [Candidatus Abyssobacteria bacterium SURF_5]|uniref:UDP-3-O-(3-hydroxymyristoyl)glucosamine N-acyltransferase n=1 Tax=Abyssobacteria bacterium (strain SURF_5) TaxID=2093360 RepID=A0A3A4NM69_ABYX5|nr:MAG: UDP-3-O-(3-hydroxymyristoyl)glucosamine N-acyltransferase [Candidatus Abyssubacteria bacterium SURF_5]
MLRSLWAPVVSEKPQNGLQILAPRGFIHYTAVIGKDVVLGKDVVVGPFVVIDNGTEIGDEVEIGPHVSIGQLVKIGSGTVIHPHVSIREKVEIGQNVVINSGTVIGSDGFGFTNSGGKNYKIPQLGTVVIEDDVWIGSNVTIDRATVGATRVRRSAQIHNLVQIGHNVDIGEETIVRPRVGIAGSTTIGSETYVGEQAGIINHIEIGRRVTVHPFSGITKKVGDGESVMGAPARPLEVEKSVQSFLLELPDLARNIQSLKRKFLPDNGQTE